jgi:UDP-3-O-[3-hydroxymyristoyl] glucosamine N-acyltransferase
MKLADLARHLNCRLEGDAGAEITGCAGLEAAGPGQLSFLANPKYRAVARSTQASAILIAAGETRPQAVAALWSLNPYLDFARALELFYQPPQYAPHIHPTAVIAASARIGEGAHIGPHCFVDDAVVIGRHAVLHSHVTIYCGAHIGDHFLAHAHSVVREGCHIGHRVILQNGAVVGADGFGFAKRPDGRWHKIVQSGPAVIEDDVEIQALAAVDRATVGETRIRRGAKIDNLVQVGHASDVGEDTLLCAQVGLAGSTVVGGRCILAGQVGAAGHLEIGDGAVLTAQSGVPSDVPAGALFSGYPAMENKQWLKAVAVFHRLPELQREVRTLRAELDELRGKKTKR